MKKIRRLAAFAGFLAVLIAVLSVNSALLEQKYSKAVMGGFYELEEDSVDVIFAGSSHMLNGVLPMKLWENYGFTSYNIGQHGQRLNMTYYYIKEAIKKQHPKVVVVDLYYAFESQINDDAANLHKSVDNLQWGASKIGAIMNAAPKSLRLELFYNMFLYHTRWNELEKEDFLYLTERPYNNTGGTELRWGNVEFTSPNVIPADQTKELTEDTVEALEKIVNLAAKNNVELVFTVFPYIAEDDYQACYNMAGQILQAAGQHYVNLMYRMDELGIDFSKDFYDSEHLNPAGAEKVTDYFGRYLKENFQLEDNRQKEEYAGWNTMLERYEREVVAGKTGAEGDPVTYLSYLSDPEYAVGIVIKPDQMAIGEEVTGALGDLGIDTEELVHRDNNYVCMIDGGEILVDDSTEAPQAAYTQELGGIAWEITCGSDIASVMIDLREWALNKESINIVVYDKVLQKVVDSVCITNDGQQLIRK